MPKSRFHSQLEAKIHEAIAQSAEFIVSGAPYDFAQYKHNTGFIGGLKKALELAEEIERED